MKLLVVPLFLAAALAVVSSSYINLNYNGYQKVLVGISPSVTFTDATDATAFLDKLKNIFIKASERLYDATKKRAFFQDVHFLLPENFPHIPGERHTTWQNYKTSDVFVDTPNPLHGDVPYASQPKGCAQQGDYIHITPNYVSEDTDDETLESMAAQFVHVWSRFRYGIFEEYGRPKDDQFPMFYYDDNENLVYTSCSDSPIVGTMKDVTTGGNCVFDQNTFLPDYKCGLFADEDKTKAESSIMSVSYLKSIHTFCDDEDHPHNADAPTKHNLICNGESTWSVVKRSVDFAGNVNPPRDITPLSPPTFTLVRTNAQEGGDVVFVLDTSKSMHTKTVDRIDWIKAALAYWIEMVLPDKTSLGLVRFSNWANTLMNLTKLDSSNRQSIYDTYIKPLNAVGETAIGDGIIKGLQVLAGDGNTVGDIMILLTDGQENEAPYIKDVIQRVKDSGIVIITIALSQEADREIENLAALTNGYTFYADDTTSIYALSNALETVLDILNPYDANTIVLENKFLGAQGSGSFIVDKYFDEVDITVMYANGDVNSIQLNGPNKVPFSLADFTPQPTFNMYTLKLKTDIAGPWTYNITATDSKASLAMRVVGLITTPDVHPITANAWGSVLTGRLGTKYIFLYARVMQGNHPVINAEVTAYVTTPLGNTREIKLLDNGNIISDQQKHDGIYSRIMTSYDGRGRYTFNVVVKSGDETFIITDGGKSNTNVRTRRAISTERSRNLYPQDPTEFNHTSSGDFNRNPAGFSLNLLEDVTGLLFPPGVVKSLVSTWNDKDSTFNITWSAPGSSADSGIVSSYELKYSTKRGDLNTTESFEKAPAIKSENVVGGTMTPVNAGHVQDVVVKLDGMKVNTVYYFALRSITISGTSKNVSDISNIAFISTAINPPTEAPTKPTEAPTKPTEAPTQSTVAPTKPTEAPTKPTEAPVESSLHFDFHASVDFDFDYRRGRAPI